MKRSVRNKFKSLAEQLKREQVNKTSKCDKLCCASVNTNPNSGVLDESDLQRCSLP